MLQYILNKLCMPRYVDSRNAAPPVNTAMTDLRSLGPCTDDLLPTSVEESSEQDTHSPTGGYYHHWRMVGEEGPSRPTGPVSPGHCRGSR